MERQELQRFRVRLGLNFNDSERWREIFVEFMQRCRETQDDEADDKIAGFVYACLTTAIATTRDHEREILTS